MLIFNQDNISLYTVDSYDDSKKLGNDTYWCISLYKEWFNIHKDRNEDFIFVFNNNLIPDDENSKLCLTIKINEGTCELTNKYNETYKPSSEKETHCLNILGKPVVDFLFDYINKTYNN